MTARNDRRSSGVPHLTPYPERPLENGVREETASAPASLDLRLDHGLAGDDPAGGRRDEPYPVRNRPVPGPPLSTRGSLTGTAGTEPAHGRRQG